MSIFSDISTFYRKVVMPEDETKDMIAERLGETITPNMRALRLSMTVADYLLSMNVAVSDVTDVALSITDRYCERKVSVEIIATVLMFSQDRGNDREPLTLIRPMTPRAVNSSLLQEVQDIAYDIHKGKLSLSKAEVRLEKLLTAPKSYPQWVRSIGSGALSAGIVAVLSNSPIIIGLAFLVGVIISYIPVLLSKHRIPPFFVQVVATIVATLIAALVTWLGNNGVGWLQGIDPNLIIIGGIVLLVAGLSIVAAVEDALDEYYITANARILRVILLTAGIVVGIIVGLSIAKALGVTMVVSTESRVYTDVVLQLFGAAAVAAGYALSVNTRFGGILLAGLVGAGGWGIYLLSAPAFGQVAASFMAAGAVGIGAGLLARWLRTPPTIMVTAGIIALVPGLSLFNGLMALVVGVGESGSLTVASIILLNALFAALAIAAGASFGNLVARPIKRTFARAHNALPRRKLRN